VPLASRHLRPSGTRPSRSARRLCGAHARLSCGHAHRSLRHHRHAAPDPGWIIIIQVILSWLVAFNVINTTGFVRGLLVGARPDHRAALPADPQDPARFRRDRFLADGAPADHPDPAQAAARRPRAASRAIAEPMTAADRRKGGRRRLRAGSPRRSRLSAPHGPRAGPRGRAGRRGSGERGLCPLQGQGDLEAGMASFEHKLRRHVSEGELLALVDRSTPTRRSTASSSSCRSRRRSTPRRSSRDRPGQGRRRLPPVNAGRLAIGLDGLRPLHAARLPDAAEGPSSAI
jgi:hypothetical protein